MDKRLKKMTAIFFLAAAADLFLAAVLLASLARQRAEGATAPGTGRVVEDGGWSGGWDGPGTEEVGAVALTFDDGPWPKTTEALLDGLAQRGVKATFFLVGEQVADHQDTVRRMADEGHQIGLHTWHHVSLQGMTREEIAAQLGKTQQTIQAVVGPEELMLRPPYGFVDETLKQWAKTPIVCWSVDTEDWKDQNVERIVQTVTQQAEDGDIILMHDIFETSVTAALACVDRLMAQGYYFVTVEELFALRGEVPQEGGVYLSLPPKT